jgi:hypothetical protein
MQLKYVYDSEMDTADIGGVIIDQADDSIVSAAAFDFYFFIEFPLHSRTIPIVAARVVGRYVPADPDAALGMKPTFTLSFASGVLKNFRAFAIRALQNDVRNQLFVSRVGFANTSR